MYNVSGDYVYYSVMSESSNSTDIGVYKVKTDGSNRTKLTNGYARYLCVIADWIYFDTGNGLNRVKTDGTNLEQVK